MFKVTGTINGTEESITYTWEQGHGRIEGDPMVMFLRVLTAQIFILFAL